MSPATEAAALSGPDEAAGGAAAIFAPVTLLAKRLAEPLRRVLALQGMYYVATGV